jgi:hypothetical protein
MKAHHIFAVFLVSLGCAYGQMTVIGGPSTDPDVKPEQRTATILHYERVRTTARRSIGILALALQNEDGGSKPRVAAAINNEQDIVDSANWCIRALRDKTEEAVSCAFPTAQSDATESQGICQAAENPRVRSHCSQVATSAKRIESSE